MLAHTPRYPILMYHQIRPLPPPSDRLRSLSVAPDAFRRQMTLFKRLGYRGLSVRELQPYLRGERQGKVFGISFDDGFLNVLTHAMPVLDALGFTATCYFVAGRFGGANDWDAGAPTARSPLMTCADMLAWRDHGHEIGSHTLDHVALSHVSAPVSAFQLTESKRQLEMLSGQCVESFCYPYGDLDARVRDQVIAAGYDNATTTRRGCAGAADDPFLLPRIPVAGGVGAVRLWFKCMKGRITGCALE
ncbi:MULTISPECIES: polysaccharide deacetylase family protein [unclassified Burkholderia]|uniref:polysaccharide deacetylase family protein n=1 Tax=unclassified Burkholderia TaxID=2613784 RepID=UPI0007565249|nr:MULTISPECIES: polysaccharide deacetylase family protein [unclassified Burkholderia]AOI74838.1 polysaccharide deacetylase [Burkholderia sp. NRF60-BP8]KVA03980.1 polysaccharide deacetylase [Burkholderia sp. NRF60-BP8]KVL08369.1 polysaccharide deacetylase [Burkholderia sp. MSMB1826]